MTNIEKIYWVYITTQNTEQARMIGKKIVEERLAACVNILPQMFSIYRWEGQVVEDEETVLIAKTTAAKLKILTERVKELHTYQIPCIIALPVELGDITYLNWLRNEMEIKDKA